MTLLTIWCPRLMKQNYLHKIGHNFKTQSPLANSFMVSSTAGIAWQTSKKRSQMNHFKFLSQCHTFGTLFPRTSHIYTLLMLPAGWDRIYHALTLWQYNWVCNLYFVTQEANLIFILYISDDRVLPWPLFHIDQQHQNSNPTFVKQTRSKNGTSVSAKDHIWPRNPTRGDTEFSNSRGLILLEEYIVTGLVSEYKNWLLWLVGSVSTTTMLWLVWPVSIYAARSSL